MDEIRDRVGTVFTVTRWICRISRSLTKGSQAGALHGTSLAVPVHVGPHSQSASLWKKAPHQQRM